MRKTLNVLSVAVVLCCTGNVLAEKPTERVLDNVRASVVRIEVVRLRPPRTFVPGQRPRPEPILPVPLRPCFGDGYRCILGTGIVVSSSGDVITASHVARDVTWVMNLLRDSQIDSRLEIGISVPNVENKNVTLASASMMVDADIKVVDPLHDLALLHVAELPPRTEVVKVSPKASNSVFSPGWPNPVRLAPERAKDAEPIFACGFPLFEVALVTTNGTIASAWSSEVVLTARNDPHAFPIGIYKLDIQLTHGNSGGPVFRLSDQSVVGIVIEGDDNHPGAPPIAVPARYITEFLAKNGVSWVESKTAKSRKGK